MPSDLDILMASIQEINAKAPTDLTDQELDRLIAYHRHNRARRAAGEKPSRPAKAVAPKVDVLGILSIAPKPALPKPTGTVRRT